MLGHREFEPEDYLAIARRRKWWIIAPAIVVPLIAFGVSLFLPERWTSQTMVLVEQQKVPDNYVKPILSEDLNERLATMKEQILSRTRLQPIIERFELYPEKGLPMEERLALMRKAVTVVPMRSEMARTGGLPGFYIGFSTNNARLAQQVCSEITSMFLSENLKAREQSAQGTNDFLAKQLDDAKRNLDEQDAKLADFQRKYIGQLPGQEQTNLNMLTTLNTQLDAATQALNRLQQDRTYAETMLNQQLAAWHSAKGPVVVDADALQKELEQKQSQLVDLKARYTDDHPDVVSLQRKIDALRKSMAAKPQSATAPVVPEPPSSNEPKEIQQLRAQLRALDQAVADKKNEQQRVQHQIGIYQGRIQLSPVVQEEFKKVTRDYQTALQFYNDLLAKKNQSEMATDLERRQQGEQFRVMDPPNLPEKPVFPNRQLFAGGGLAGGLFLGIGLALLLEWKDKSLRNERDVLHFLKLPTLALLPSVDETAPNVRRGLFAKRRKKLAADAVAERGA
ncbi:MAG TPA: Wzz/FepE/Etk N-terminal domain-containing protein [Terriglobales bacterium]|jgi:polysaccharide chain length determinant protein (PEP-CTERM system associated)|nr:Wzz/FepE/Etk N-terminal domain-containing protein [Terriglobales bacterium]